MDTETKNRFDDLYWRHKEQARERYPNAMHIRFAKGIDPERIESKVILADGMKWFISEIARTGEITHWEESY